MTEMLLLVRGSKILIDQLDEGVVVLDQNIHSVQYSNQKAKVLLEI